MNTPAQLTAFFSGDYQVLADRRAFASVQLRGILINGELPVSVQVAPCKTG